MKRVLPSRRAISNTAISAFLFVLMVTTIALQSQSVVYAQDDVKVVRYPAADMEEDVRSAYYYKLLEVALENTKSEYGDFKLEGVKQSEQSQTESLKSMMRNQGLDVIHTMTTKARELVLRPIHIPLDKGLIGMRLLLINEEDQDLFTDVEDKSDLKQITFGQGEGWPDTEILNLNGFEVETNPQYGKLFEMLAKKRFLAFPRAVYEIWAELEQFDEYSFAAENKLLIYYPAAMYFFVRKADKELAQRIETGLKRAMADGTFDKLFKEYMGSYVEKARLNERMVIELSNPMLSDEVPVNKPELWYDLPN